MCQKRKSQEKLGDILNQIKRKATYQKFGDVAKAMLRKKFIAVNVILEEKEDLKLLI